MDGTHKTAFRKWFSYFGELRAIYPFTTLLEYRFRSLEDIEFEINRHKRNKAVTKLRISKVSNEVDCAMKWLIDALNDLKENFLRTIIYCNSTTNASKMHTHITSRIFRGHEYVSLRNYNQIQGSD